MTALQADIDAELRTALGPLRERAERALSAAAADWTGPEDLVGAMRHALSGGGKRIRPALVLATTQTAGGAVEDGEAAAVALELVHTYSLVHDDLPAMDDDALRRGLPTVHIAFGQALAILAGDALLTEAFRHLAGASRPPESRRCRAVAVLAEASGHLGMVAGQARDIAVPEATLAAFRKMHADKTGALFVAACRLGAVCAGAAPRVEEALIAFGRHLGEAFQVSDDLIDYFEEREEGAHETEVNVATLLGPREAAELVARDVVAAQQALASLPGDGAVLSMVARWVDERARRTLSGASG